MPGRILIVEDEPVCRKLLAARLTQAGFVVLIPPEENDDVVAAAFEMQKEEQAPFVITDLTLPGEGGGRSVSNGIGLIAKIKRLNRATRVYVLTGTVERNVLAHLKKLGVRASFLKEDADALSRIIADLSAAASEQT